MRLRWWLCLVIVLLATGCAWAAKGQQTHPCQTGYTISCSRFDGGGFYQDDATGMVIKYVGQVVWSGPFKVPPPRKWVPYVSDPDTSEKGFIIRPVTTPDNSIGQEEIGPISGMEVQFHAHPGHWYTEAQIVQALQMYDDVTRDGTHGGAQ